MQDKGLRKLYCNLKVTYLGDYVKITSVQLKTSSKVTATINQRIVNNKKLVNNLVRAKNRITDLALANDFKFFFTITFNTNWDRFNLDYLRLSFRSVIRLIRDKYNIQLKYLVIPEQHKNGAWHLHGFFTEDIELLFKTNEFGHIYIPEFSSLGFHNIQYIVRRERIASYVTKYVSKNLANGIGRHQHSYFASSGLKSGTLVIDKLYDNEYFNEHFFEFGNDYCYRKIMSLVDFQSVLPLLRKL